MSFVDGCSYGPTTPFNTHINIPLRDKYMIMKEFSCSEQEFHALSEKEVDDLVFEIFRDRISGKRG